MAEGIARAMAPASVRISSAGAESLFVRPEAVEVLAEIGIVISGHRAKTMASLTGTDTVDTVITLCSDEVCPVFLRRVVQVTGRCRTR